MNYVRLFACRTYGVLAGCLAGLSFIAALPILYWAKYGPPPATMAELEKVRLPIDTHTFLGVLGVALVLISVTHTIVSVFAMLGRVWPMLVTTIVWGLLLTPSIIAPQAPGAAMMSAAILVVLCTLTVAGTLGRSGSRGLTLTA